MDTEWLSPRQKANWNCQKKPVCPAMRRDRGHLISRGWVPSGSEVLGVKDWEMLSFTLASA